MSPRGRTQARRKRNALIGGAAGLIGAIAAIVAIYSTGGQEDLIPPVPPGGDVVRIDYLFSRDYDPGGAIPAGGVGDNKPLATDVSWTQTGGEKCYPISTTDASCFSNTEVPYTVDATGLGIPVEPDAVNRITFSTDIDCVNWTCNGTGTATPLQTAPDGSATASLLTIDNGTAYVYKTNTGYTASGAVYPRVWVQCNGSNDLDLRNSATTTLGQWTVDCSQVNGQWTLIHSASQAEVSETYSWAANGSGGAGFLFFGVGGAVSAYVWAPTLTEEPGTGLMVIPTGASAVSTGDIAWVIDNTSTNYYRAGDTVTQSLSQISGMCWVVSGTDLLLSGASGSECSGVWYSLRVSP